LTIVCSYGYNCFSLEREKIKKGKKFLGVTRNELEYRPRLCKIEKMQSGFGFSLLYLEDREGEYVEDVTSDGPGQLAGANLITF